MWLIAYKAWFFNKNLDKYKQVLLTKFLEDPLQNTCHVFNNVLQGQVLLLGF
jgi:hypothetical protein